MGEEAMKENEQPSANIQKLVEEAAIKAVTKAMDEYTKPRKEETISDKAKKENEDEEKTKRLNESIEKAAVFNSQINEFLSKNETFLPKTASKIVQKVSEQKYDDSVKRANALRKELIAAFFEFKENLEVLPENFREKVKTFNDLSEDAKASRSEEFFELVTLGINQKEMIIRQKNIEKANKGLVDDSSKEYMQKFYDKANERYGIKKNAA